MLHKQTDIAQQVWGIISKEERREVQSAAMSISIQTNFKEGIHQLPPTVLLVRPGRAPGGAGQECPGEVCVLRQEDSKLGASLHVTLRNKQVWLVEVRLEPGFI